MTEVRNQIRRRVHGDPGIHFNELERELDLATGQTQYHVHRLLRSDEIVSECLYGRTHYYSTEYDQWDRQALGLLRRETCRDVVIYLLARGSADPATVAEELGIARSTLEWHLSHLVECDLVRKEYDERNRVSLHLVEPEQTGELLTHVTPSVADRLVDRFSRLVDSLLEDVEAEVDAD